MRYAFAIAATMAVATATDFTNTPCGNLCANGAAPSKIYTSTAGTKYAICPSTDFPGHGIDDPVRFDVANAEALAELCDAAPGCIAGTAKGGFGYLKDAVPTPADYDESGENSSFFKIFPDACPVDGTTTTSTTPAAATTTTPVAVTSTTTTTNVVTTTTVATTTPAAATTTTSTPAATTAPTTSKTSTTAPATTTTSKATCPTGVSSSDLITVGGKSYYKFFAGEKKRNSFSYAQGGPSNGFASFDWGLSHPDAIQKCAEFITNGISKGNPWAQTFQIFKYWNEPEHKTWCWHCDASFTANYDSNFKDNDGVISMYQYNAYPDECKPTGPPAATTTTKPAATTTPAKTTLVTSTTKASPTPTWADWSERCPSRKDVQEICHGNTKFYVYLFKASEDRRNSFQWSNYKCIDKKYSYKQAWDVCSKFAAEMAVTKGDWPAFQLFEYRSSSDNSWHCDTSKTKNVDSDFNKSYSAAQYVDAIFQWNKVPDYCKY